MIHRPCPMIGWSLVSSRLFSEQGACRGLRPAAGPLLPMRMCCAFRSGRAATGAAASPGGCRAVGFCPCYKTSIDDANRIG